MAQNDFQGFLELESTTSLANAISGTQLRAMDKTIGRLNIIKSLSFFITHFNNNFNAKGKLTPTQIIVLSGDLFELFQYETLEDAMLMFKYARIGKIGDGKDFKLDSQAVFHKWVPAYLELKAEEREKLYSKSKEEHKAFNPSDINPDVSKKMFENVGEETMDHDRKGGGIGSRQKIKLKKAKVITNRTDYLAQMRQKAKTVSNENLKNYLIKFDIKSDRYDPQVYEMVENEIDQRLKAKGKTKN